MKGCTSQYYALGGSCVTWVLLPHCHDCNTSQGLFQGHTSYPQSHMYSRGHMSMHQPHQSRTKLPFSSWRGIETFYNKHLHVCSPYRSGQTSTRTCHSFKWYLFIYYWGYLIIIVHLFCGTRCVVLRLKEPHHHNSPSLYEICIDPPSIIQRCPLHWKWCHQQFSSLSVSVHLWALFRFISTLCCYAYILHCG